jgi:hypothetical protein
MPVRCSLAAPLLLSLCAAACSLNPQPLPPETYGDAGALTIATPTVADAGRNLGSGTHGGTTPDASVGTPPNSGKDSGGTGGGGEPDGATIGTPGDASPASDAAADSASDAAHRGDSAVDASHPVDGETADAGADGSHDDGSI